MQFNIRQAIYLLVLAVTLVLVSVAIGNDAEAKPKRKYDEWSASPTEPSESGIYVTGDSLTYWGANDLKTLRPKWHIEGVPGRQVQTLKLQLDQILAADPNPKAIVIGLATNTMVGHEYDGVVYGNDHFTVYPEAIVDVPASTCLVFISAYRDPKIYDESYPVWHQAWQAWQYTQAMKELDVSRPRTKIAPWRWTAANNPQLLTDGIHATVEGRKVWAKRVSDTLSTTCD